VNQIVVTTPVEGIDWFGASTTSGDAVLALFTSTWKAATQ
jgi:hypothetical protein